MSPLTQLSPLNPLAQRLRSLHIPGDPLILTNVWDSGSAAVASSHPSTAALATASFAIAQTIGVEDDSLSLARNLAAISAVASVAAAHSLPLTADLQDGYSDVRGTVRSAIENGAVGCNLEDVDCSAGGTLRPIPEAQARIREALAAATEAGVPDFVINARTDVLFNGGTVADAIERGKAYLDAGATCIFVWGGTKGRGVGSEEIKELVKALDGRVSVKMNLRPGFLTVDEVKALGVCRISIGPELWRKAMAAYKEGMEKMLRGESF